MIVCYFRQRPCQCVSCSCPTFICPSCLSCLICINWITSLFCKSTQPAPIPPIAPIKDISTPQNVQHIQGHAKDMKLIPRSCLLPFGSLEAELARELEDSKSFTEKIEKREQTKAMTRIAKWQIGGEVKAKVEKFELADIGKERTKKGDFENVVKELKLRKRSEAEDEILVLGMSEDTSHIPVPKLYKESPLF